MKYIYLLLLLGFVLTLLYWRMRPYIHAFRRALNFVRQVQGGVVVPPTAGRGVAPPPAAAQTGQLVKCAGCNTWVLEARAVKLARGRTSYCSHACLEKAVSKR